MHKTKSLGKLLKKFTQAFNHPPDFRFHSPQRQEARSDKPIDSCASPLNFILPTSYDTATSICRGFAASDLGNVRVKIPSL